MTKIFVAMIAAAMVLASPMGAPRAQEPGPEGVYVGGKLYPPCRTRADDRCVQMRMMGRDMMRDRMRERAREHMPAAPTPGTPRGCSPVTTPCE